MLIINGKTFMNLQEAVQWLLDNNALPFQSSANYVANTEIGMGTIVNPSPAKVRIGSLIFFADSKVSTVIGLTENGFIVSDQYNDLVDDIVYVSNVAINASGHLICTLSNGDTIDAGLIKQVNNFSINASQHLIANYNDGTNTDLGAIFTGNVNISGTLNATTITGDSIIENMSAAYQASLSSAIPAGWTIENVYTGIVKNGNKLTIVSAMNFTKTDASATNSVTYLLIRVPKAVHDKLYPVNIGGYDYLSAEEGRAFSAYNQSIKTNDLTRKGTSDSYAGILDAVAIFDSPVVNTKYYHRMEVTFLLSDNLI